MSRVPKLGHNFGAKRTITSDIRREPLGTSAMIVHKKFRTALFRKGGDMLSSLSWALRRGATKSESLHECKSGLSNTKENAAGILIKAGDIILKLLI